MFRRTDTSKKTWGIYVNQLRAPLDRPPPPLQTTTTDPPNTTTSTSTTTTTTAKTPTGPELS
jgi:hypothetical protein